MRGPLRVAIIGAGPAGFYAADQLLREEDLDARIDLFERLPTPYGLVRAGVAPDHQNIKNVTKAFDAVARHPRFRFLGGIEFGSDVTLPDLRERYHQVLFTTGAQSDRRLEIPGEDLQGIHGATEFVAWYNGHPDYADRTFDLGQERVAVVGVGNVALDVARILCLTPEELRATDMADHALEALSNSAIREVHVLGRRGPAQAAFSNPELQELGALQNAEVIVRRDEAKLDPASASTVASSADRTVQRKVAMLADYAACEPRGRGRAVYLRFCVAPVEALGDASGNVTTLRLVKNRLSQSETGSIIAEPTGDFEELDVGLVFRSVGYRGVPLPGVPFHERWGVILNDHGRVLDESTKKPIAGLYTAGWIKRGPTGVIGTNKADAAETVGRMAHDARGGASLNISPLPGDILEVLAARGARVVTYADWLRLDAIERERGAQLGRPRVKFTSVAEMHRALNGEELSQQPPPNA